MSMEYDSTECEFWCQIAKVRSTKQFVGLMSQTARHAFVGTCPWLCLHKAAGIFARICDDCHDDELRRSEECVSRCEARSPKGNVNRRIQQIRLPFELARSPKGNVNRRIQQIRLPLELARSQKGNVNRRIQQIRLPLELARSPKGTVNRRIQQIRLPLELARSLKSSLIPQIS